MTNLLLRTHEKTKRNYKELYNKIIFINLFKCVINAFELFKLKNISIRGCDKQNTTIGSMKVEREKANGKSSPPQKKHTKLENARMEF